MVARTLENWIKIFEFGDMTEEHFIKHLDQFDLTEQGITNVINTVVVPKRTPKVTIKKGMNMNCEKLMCKHIEEFCKEEGDHWVPCKPSLHQEMSQLKYNACTEAVEMGLPKQDIKAYFGETLYDEVMLCKHEQEMDV